MKVISVVLTSAIAILSIATPIHQATATTKTSLPPAKSTAKLALYQNTEVICGGGGITYARAETKGYYVNICGDASGPNRYLGAGKSGQAIVLPLQSYSPGRYVAASGNIRYILTSDYLTVTQSGRTLLKQRIINWR
jgi:hypothetical protein